MIFGLNTGWTLNADGDNNFGGSVLESISRMKQAQARWVRMGIGGGWNKYADWTTPAADGTTRLSQVDQVVTAVKAAGLKILGLVDPSTYTGFHQSDWSANGAGNGDNSYMQGLGQTFAMISQHYAGQVDAWEIWNEPNVWTRSYGVGNAFIYPNNFAWLLKHIKDNQQDSAPLVSGGILGMGGANNLSTGADYLTQTLQAGAAIWGGTVPFDYVGSHIYVVSPGDVSPILNAMSQTGGLPLWVTEWGWQTSSNQAAFLSQTNNIFLRSGNVAAALWFKLDDDTTMTYGLFDRSGNPKPAYYAYQQGVFMDDAIQLRWDSFFLQLQSLFPGAGIQLARKGTGIYDAWYNGMLNGKQIGPATSYEYTKDAAGNPTTDWSGVPIVCQDFGSCRIEWYHNGVNHAYGPSGRIW